MPGSSRLAASTGLSLSVASRSTAVGWWVWRREDSSPVVEQEGLTRVPTEDADFRPALEQPSEELPEAAKTEPESCRVTRKRPWSTRQAYRGR